MTHPVPDRLVPLQRKIHIYRTGAAMFALVAFVLGILAGLDVTLGNLSPADLLAFAVAAVALHLLYPLSVRR